MTEVDRNIISSLISQPALKTHSRIKQKSEVDKLRSKELEKIEEGDVKGTIRLAASDDTLAPFSPTTFEALKLKHPPRSNSVPNTQNPESPSEAMSKKHLVLDVPMISAAVISFPNGSAGGVDGLRPQHLKDVPVVVYSPSCGLSSKHSVTSSTYTIFQHLSGGKDSSYREDSLYRSITVCISKERWHCKANCSRLPTSATHRKGCQQICHSKMYRIIVSISTRIWCEKWMRSCLHAAT